MTPIPKFLLVALVMAIMHGHATIEDQSQILSDTSNDWNNGIGQTFTVGIPGKLSRISLLAFPRGSQRDLSISLRTLAPDGTPTGTILESSTLPGAVVIPETKQWLHFEFTNELHFAEGKQLGFSIELGERPTPNGYYDFFSQQNNPYPEGFFYYEGYFGTSDGTHIWEDMYHDLAFVTHVDPVAELRIGNTNSDEQKLSVLYSDPTNTYTVQFSRSISDPDWENLIVTNGTIGLFECDLPTNYPSCYFRLK